VRAWDRRNPDQNKKWRAANPERSAEIKKRWVEAHPEKRRQASREWAARNPDATNRGIHRRRGRKANVLLFVRVDSNDCGVCLQAIDPTARWPDPMSRTVGHEPPLAAAERDGWRVVAERPEHLRCNQRKQSKTDAELGA
jgi:hypothetical protein